MKRVGRTAALVAALALSAASTARAETLVNGTYCGGNEFSTCAFISSSSTTTGGVTVLTLTVANPASNNAGSVFTAIGIANLPARADVTSGTVVSASPTVKFKFEGDKTSGLNGAGIQKDVVGFGALSPSPKNGVQPGETITFRFTFDGVFDLNAIQYALHDQGGGSQKCGSSTKLVISSQNGSYSANVPDCGVVVPPVTTVPEPATMTLLATGLMGLGGISRRRKAKASSV